MWSCARIIHVNPEVQDFIEVVLLLYLDQNGHTFNHPSVLKHRVLKLLMESASILSSNEMTPWSSSKLTCGIKKISNGSGLLMAIRPETGTSLWNLGRVVPTASQPSPWECHSEVAAMRFNQASECRWSEPVMSGKQQGDRYEHRQKTLEKKNIKTEFMSSMFPFPNPVTDLIN